MGVEYAANIGEAILRGLAARFVVTSSPPPKRRAVP